MVMNNLNWKRVIVTLVGIFFLTLPVKMLMADVVYIVKERQEEKRSTRWTLTEWLKIKERMRLMDVWLAMFSEPAKSKFQPEFSVKYTHYLKAGKYKYEDITHEFPKTPAPREVDAKLFLTNLISSTTGIRTLNIDFGFAGKYHKTGVEMYGYGGVFRILGKHNQDTSLDLNVLYTHRRLKMPTIFNEVLTKTGEVSQVEQLMLRAQLQIYLMASIGIIGYYDNLPVPTRSYSGPTLRTTGQGYGGELFIEIGVIRLSYGYYKQELKVDIENKNINYGIEGQQAALTIYF